MKYRSQPCYDASFRFRSGMIHQHSLVSMIESWEADDLDARDLAKVLHPSSCCQNLRVVARLQGNEAEDERAMDLSPTVDVWPEVQRNPLVREGTEAWRV